ncbi:efflux transporter, outer membrane factor (OMF) lipoprotein, NodT family [Collimonas sp. OK307]|uniref:efflux transporter outer membrane subunit n=1 Tax=Collimonas sp. OK307 TaxID=1801620 RepID=UPI0008F3832A|nr:efflux transporter outer membrane subunit [Collimonas sp. OK307]SFH77726.1 efflux transporter, outer membrane factor (OMF) lipoprotein, NodT family [Collimonas sp. OK307]
MNFSFSSKPQRSLATSIMAAAVALSLTACAVGPDYVRPSMDVPASYKESGPWKQAQPQPIDSSNWWEVYGDATLNGLIQQANQANQNIRQAEAQYRQARAAADAARAGFWPTIGVNAGVDRARSNTNGIKLSNGYTAGVQGSWEPDVWGSVRRSVEAGDAGTQASAADLAAARLSIQATLTQDYLQLRITDLLKDLYARTTAAYTRSLQLTKSQYAAGVALRSDVALAESQLKTAEAQAIDLQAQRSQLEHAIAILTGKAPSGFNLAALPADTQMLSKMQAGLPPVPTGLPSDLLERRPDIASAERHVAVANANIGVAKAAFFPALTLNASGGFNSASLAQWFNTPSRVWSLGAALAETIFDGGLRRAHSAEAIAAYDVAVAQYKQTVLGGFQEVEDNLATLNVLDQEAIAQNQAVQASQLAERLALSQYRAGTATYLTVVTAQTLSLSNERTLVQLLGRQLLASVALIKAVGGGWDASQVSGAERPSQTHAAQQAQQAQNNTTN